MVPKGFKNQVCDRVFSYQALLLWNKLPFSISEADIWYMFRTDSFLITPIDRIGLGFLSCPLVVLLLQARGPSVVRCRVVDPRSCGGGMFVFAHTFRSSWDTQCWAALQGFLPSGVSTLERPGPCDKTRLATRDREQNEALFGHAATSLRAHIASLDGPIRGL